MLVSYEPELHPAATYRIKQLKATIQVFSTGSITVTGTKRLPIYTETDRQTDRRSVALLCILLEGSCSQRIEVKLQSTWNSFVTKVFLCEPSSFL